jgi:hypothetical protein
MAQNVPSRASVIEENDEMKDRAVAGDVEHMHDAKQPLHRDDERGKRPVQK